MTTFTAYNRGKGRTFPPAHAYAANLDYLFAAEGSTRYSGSGAVLGTSAGSPQAGLKHRMPGKRLVDVVLCGRLKKQWVEMVHA